MMYRGIPETLALGFLDVSWRNALIRQVEQGFSSFFAKFLAYLISFQSGAQKEAEKLKNHQIWQKFGKK